MTRLSPWPDYLRKDVDADGILDVFANGRIDYTIRGVHARVSVLWNFAAPLGAGDAHYSLLRGTRASLVIQARGAGALRAHAVCRAARDDEPSRTWEAALKEALPRVQAKFPGIETRAHGSRCRVEVPAKYHVGHEAHFGQVTGQFLRFNVTAGALPAWEVPNMLAKYSTTTQALASATRTACGGSITRRAYTRMRARPTAAARASRIATMAAHRLVRSPAVTCIRPCSGSTLLCAGARRLRCVGPAVGTDPGLGPAPKLPAPRKTLMPTVKSRPPWAGPPGAKPIAARGLDGQRVRDRARSSALAVRAAQRRRARRRDQRAAAGRKTARASRAGS